MSYIRGQENFSQDAVSITQMNFQDDLDDVNQNDFEDFLEGHNPTPTHPNHNESISIEEKGMKSSYNKIQKENFQQKISGSQF